MDTNVEALLIVANLQDRVAGASGEKQQILETKQGS